MQIADGMWSFAELKFDVNESRLELPFENSESEAMFLQVKFYKAILLSATEYLQTVVFDVKDKNETASSCLVQ